MLLLMKIITSEYEKAKRKGYNGDYDDYEEMFWYREFGMKPAEWDGRPLYISKEIYDRHRTEIEEWERFD